MVAKRINMDALADNLLSGYDYMLPVEDTLNFISEECRSDNPFFFIRISDVDKRIMHAHSRLERQEKDYIQRRGELPFELTDPNLRKELIEAAQLATHPNVTLAPYAKGIIAGLTKPFHNYYSFEVGFLYPDLFIPFLKNTLNNTLLICNDIVGASLDVKKVFGVDTTYVLPTPAYFSLDDHYDSIKALARQHFVVVCAVGFSSKVLAKRLCNDGVDARVIDIGSIVDPLAGSFNRQWSRKLKNKKFASKDWDIIRSAYLDAFR